MTPPRAASTSSGTQRIRDGFLEARAHQEHATGAGLGALSGTYADIEATFGEPSTTGLQSQLSSFWNAWSTVANDPGSSGPRSLLLEQADTLADTVNGFSTQLTQQWSATRDQVASTVADVNSMTSEVARLNAAVRSATLNGGQPNELADQRDLLVTRIAEATGAVASSRRRWRGQPDPGRADARQRRPQRTAAGRRADQLPRRPPAPSP